MQKKNLTTSRNLFKKIGVIGAGVMGTGIAAQIANAGIDCLLLDIVPNNYSNDEKKNDKSFRNKIANTGLQKAIKMKPALFFSKQSINKITIGNLEDDFNQLSSCDWIIEVIIEKLEIKKKLFSKLENILNPQTIVSSNTSGLSIDKMLEGRSDNFKKHFLVTHFFNPVRYLHLLEIIKGQYTNNDVISCITAFGEDVLGKGIVYGKDTANFVANRIGVFSMMETMRLMKKYNYIIEEIDAIFGPASGRPKSAIFRTADIVGLDTFIHVTENCYNNLPHDEQQKVFKTPNFLQKMVDYGWLGSKTRQGFYKKEDKTIKVLDLSTMTYKIRQKIQIESLNKIKNIENIVEKIKFLTNSKDKAGLLAFKVSAATCIYSANRLGEIADDIVQIDNAMKWGFGWELGPFEIWDAMGVKKSSERMIKEGYKVPNWVLKMLESGQSSFYNYNSNANKTYYNHKNSINVEILNNSKISNFTIIKSKSSNIVKDSFATSLVDLGDGILACEFHSKMNAIDGDIIQGINDALDLCEDGKFAALVIANDSVNFSVGANILLLYIATQEKAWNQIEQMVQNFQNICKRLKYSNIPTIAAPFQLTLGGGAEIALWCNKIRAHAELYMGLVEVGVGLIPGGGGNIEMLARTLEGSIDEATYPTERLIKRSLEIVAMAKVVTSATEAKENLYMHKTDGITMNRRQLLQSAKNEALGMYRSGFVPPGIRTFRLPGKSAYATFKMTLDSMKQGNFISEHDFKIAIKIAHIMTGGNCSSHHPVSEQYLLDLEKEAFLSLCGETKSQDRISFMIRKNKPLRN